MSTARTTAAALTAAIAIFGTTVSTPSGLASASPEPTVDPALELSVAEPTDTDHDHEHPVATADTVGELVVHGDSPELLADAEWAVGRFAAAGLELPGGELHLHDDRADCAAPDGRLRNGYMSGGPGGFELHVCTNRSVLLHELAHLWDNHAMTDELRTALMDLRGLETWNHDLWNQAGGEHLASIIAWGLGGGRPTSISQIDDASLATAYELVTGTAPLALTENGLELVDGRVRAATTTDRPAASAAAAAENDVAPEYS